MSESDVFAVLISQSDDPFLRFQNHIQLSAADTILSFTAHSNLLLHSYPNSKWDNIRNNMARGHVISPSVPPEPLPASSATSSGDCAGVAVWDSSVGYRLKTSCYLSSTLTSRTRLSTRADKRPPTVFVSSFIFKRSRGEIIRRGPFMDRKVVDTGRCSRWFWCVLCAGLIDK